MLAANGLKQTEIRMVELVFPEIANHYGTLFGGAALNLMAKAAFVAASRRARSAVVVARCEHIEFLRPIAIGQLFEMTAHVSRVGRSSMTIEVVGIAEELRNGERQIAIKAQFEMVAVDDKGKSTPIDQHVCAIL